jgi:hypothetical protein
MKMKSGCLAILAASLVATGASTASAASANGRPRWHWLVSWRSIRRY